METNGQTFGVALPPLLMRSVIICCYLLAGDVASVVDGERSGSDKVHNVEPGIEAEGRKGLDEV